MRESVQPSRFTRSSSENTALEGSSGLAREAHSVLGERRRCESWLLWARTFGGGCPSRRALYQVGGLATGNAAVAEGPLRLLLPRLPRLTWLALPVVQAGARLIMLLLAKAAELGAVTSSAAFGTETTRADSRENDDSLRQLYARYTGGRHGLVADRGKSPATREPMRRTCRETRMQRKPRRTDARTGCRQDAMRDAP